LEQRSGEPLQVVAASVAGTEARRLRRDSMLESELCERQIESVMIAVLVKRKGAIG
jgi:hypothetical protein